ncbi:hypothetical protein RYX36_009972, partial [Vicia faba]
DSTNNYFTDVVCPFIFSENMAINRVYFFLAILCIALVLHPGGARRYEEIMSDDITTDCFDTPECPLSNESCLQRCGRR